MQPSLTPDQIKTLRDEITTLLLRAGGEDLLALLIDDAGLNRARIKQTGFLEADVHAVLRWCLAAQGDFLQRFLDQVHQHFPDATLLVDPLEKHIATYRQKIEARYQSLELAGFGKRLRANLDLEALYVPLHAVADLRPVGKAVFADAEDAEHCLEAAQGGRQLTLLEAFQAPGMARHRGIVILGDPGSGKTTHLKRLLLWCLRQGPESLGLPSAMLPVFLPLRELQDLEAGLETFIQAQLTQPQYKVPPGFGKRLLERGNLLCLLDGLDEVADVTHRQKVSSWIDEAVAYHPSCRFVVTCRFAGYTPEARLGNALLEMHLRPLDWEQVEKFVHNWYGLVETHMAVDPEQGRLEAESRAKDLLERLRQPNFRAARVFSMTRNPLLLANLCLVHRDRGRLPERRARLYDECIEVLLERWRESKHLEGIPAEAGRKVLQPAALWLHSQEGERTRAAAKELVPVIEPVLKRTPELSGDAKAFLRRVRDESGLLTGWSGDQYGFMHLGFQEHLAARELRNRSFEDPGLLRQLASSFGESWWQEVTLLLLAIGEQPAMFTPFMRELVKLPQMVRFSELLEVCFEEAADISPFPFVELVEATLVSKVSIEAEADSGAWERVLLALKILGRHFPDVQAELSPRLEAHPSEAVRAWARQQSVEAMQPVIRAARGGYELVLIPGGTFLMGSPETEEGRGDDEGPVHEVQVPPFYLGRYPVTNEEYGRFLKENPNAPEPRYWSDSRFNQARQPVVGVSWEEAKQYAAWAGLRLPSEAEWEYACRAGSTMRYYSGDKESDLARVAWYKVNSGGELHPVGEKEPNAFGLYDMLGNVWEWVEDDYHMSHDRAPKDGSAWVDNPRGSDRVDRGGSWYSDPQITRVAYRRVWWASPSGRWSSLGIRLSRST